MVMLGAKTFPPVERLSKTVVRVLGQNPGPYTLQGTNTYLIGEHNPYVLVDTGEGRETYIPFLKEALQDASSTIHPDKPHISDIILTHKHQDHCNGLPSVLTLLRQLWSDQHGFGGSTYQPPRVHKFPLSTHYASLRAMLDTLATMPEDSFIPNASGGPFHELRNAQTLPVTTSGPDSSTGTLEILHTPGHTTDSVCLYYPIDHALFTADTVLGHGSSVFEELGPYMASLRKMIDFGEGGTKYGKVYPGHGPVVVDGFRHVKNYLHHRVTREEQIVKQLRTSPPVGQPWTTWSLVSSIYAEYPRELWDSAASSVDMHLRKLEVEGRVECHGGDGKHLEWELVR